MTIDPSVQPGAFDARQPVSADEVLKLRRMVWSDGNVSPQEAAQLFALNDQSEPGSDWTDFFVEALTEYLIARGQPRGYVSQADADWLIANISRDGRVESHAELELLAKLLERAEYVPDSLKQFALAEVETIVLTGAGCTRRGGELTPGRIDEAEVALLRRFIFAPAGDGPACVSRAEADMLFRLKDATLGADNAADWPRLFVQGVANHLMAHQSFTPNDGAAQLKLESTRKPEPIPTSQVRAEIRRNPLNIGEILLGKSEEDKAAEHEAAVARDAAVTADESAWLARLFEADGARDSLELELLDFLEKDGARPF